MAFIIPHLAGVVHTICEAEVVAESLGLSFGECVRQSCAPAHACRGAAIGAVELHLESVVPRLTRVGGEEDGGVPRDVMRVGGHRAVLEAACHAKRTLGTDEVLVREVERE